jgi:prepilin-type N-terminal cleavage/methylation domain-containing protein
MKNKQQFNKSDGQQGFTLVELSIVLVIIGLIVSGILVGQDMIRAAEIRSTVSQIESFNTAVNTFRDKYRNLPGDMLSTDATRFGFQTRAGAAGQGDGNRFIQSSAPVATTPFTERYLGRETSLFWRDLSFAKLIGGNYSTATDALEAPATAANIADLLPTANIGQGHYFTIHAEEGRNHFSITQISAVAAGVYTNIPGMTPQTAFNIDDKMDDGNPITGIIVGMHVTNNALPVTTTIPIIDTTAAVAATAGLTFGACGYDSNGATAGIVASYTTISEAQANRPACQLRVRASF